MKIKKIIPFLIALLGLTPIASIVISCSATNNNSIQQGNDQNQGNQDSQPTPTPPSNEQKKPLDAQGGVINNLNVDKYKVIVEKLKLNQDSILSNLTNNDINQLLKQNDEYKNLNLKILSGSSENTGTLKLALSGNYNDQDYNETINITGFNTSDTYPNHFKVSDVKLNYENWFDKSQPIAGGNQNLLNQKEDILALIADAKFIFTNNKTLNLDEIKNTFLISNVSWKLDGNKNQITNLKFILTTKDKKEYDENTKSWVISSNANLLQQDGSNNVSFSLPTLKKLMNYILEKTTLNEQWLADYYPSYFKGLFLYSFKNDDKSKISTLLDALNVEEIINKYKNTYFSNKTLFPQIAFDTDNDVIANDFNGKLEFKVYLIDDDNANDKTSVRTFETNKCKNITSLWESLPSTDIITVKKDSNLFNTIQSKKYFNDEKKLKNYLYYSWLLYGNVFSSDKDYKKNDENAKKINDNLLMSLFGQDLSDKFTNLQCQVNGQSCFDIDSGLFNIYKKDDSLGHYVDNTFLIESITFKFDELHSTTLTDKDLSFIVPLSIYCSGKEKVINVTFILNGIKTTY